MLRKCIRRDPLFIASVGVNRFDDADRELEESMVSLFDGERAVVRRRKVRGS
jgi:hypothetical protein